MGDRTCVTLTVLNEDRVRAAAFFGNFEPEHSMSDNTHTHISFYEVNYGDLPFLDELQENGIAFDSHWDPGSEFGSGTEYCRFLADGSVWRTPVMDEEINPKLSLCMELIDRLEELKNFIVEHYDKVTPPSWEHQIEYGKLYQARQLINPD